MGFFNSIKEAIIDEKKTLTDYEFAFNYYFMLPFIVVGFFGPVLALMFALPIGVNTDWSSAVSIPFIIWGVLVVLFCIAYFIIAPKIEKRAVSDKAEFLSVMFFKNDFMLAKKKLIADRIITEQGFIIENDNNSEIVNYEDYDKDFIVKKKEKEILKFENAAVVFFPKIAFKEDVLLKALNTRENTNIQSNAFENYISILDKSTGGWKASYKLDNNIFNFLIENLDLLQNRQLFGLLMNDKLLYAKLFRKYKGDGNKILQSLEKRN